MNEQIKRDMRTINYQFLAMLVVFGALAIGASWGLAVVIRYAVASVLQAL